ncbi:MAG: hypothetical protein KIT11_10580 [Fimbriimonadaceae bacterium]|nr:hypothetical protein [Fimbriimonadaceae bacterium]QYK55765.1 MAG: hypothetical protein KF733_12250 [Fimbriimonadaceae bacterium]
MGALCSLSIGQPTGRFVPGRDPVVAGFKIDAEGFQADHPAADKFRWSPAPKSLSLSLAKGRTGFYRLEGGSGAPTAVRVNLDAPGWAVFFPGAARFRVTSNSAPYLSTPEATFGTSVPTPQVRWIAVTFTDNQPPVVLIAEEAEAGWVCEGRPGNWQIRSTGGFQGWVRVGLPLGAVGHATPSASGLGRVLKALAPAAMVMAAPEPHLVSTDYQETAAGIRVVWRYDRQGAVVPPAVVLGKAGGYALRVASSVADLGAPTSEGPLYVTGEPKLAVEFPVPLFARGRPVARGNLDTLAQPESVSIPGLAARCLVASSTLETREAASAARRRYLAAAKTYSAGPSGAKLPFNWGGEGLEAAAEQALLAEALALPRSEPIANPLLAALTDAVDPLTWRIPVDDLAAGARSAELVALAAFVRGSSADRALAGQLTAGTYAGLAFPAFARRVGLPPETVIEPWFRWMALGTGLLRKDGPDLAQSPLRLLSNHSVTADETGRELRWAHYGGVDPELRFASDSDFRLEPLENLRSLQVEQAFGEAKVTYVPLGPGICRARLTREPWARPLPVAPAWP